MSSEARRTLSIYLRRKWLLLAVVILIPAAVFAISTTITKTYEASTTLIVRSTNVGPDLFGNSLSLSVSGGEDAAFLVDTNPVGQEAARQLGEDPDEGRSLLSHVTASLAESSSNSSSSDFMTITASASTADRAADLANAFAAALTLTRTGDAQDEIQETIDQLKKQSKELGDGEDDATAREENATQLQQLQGLQASQTNATTVIERAIPPSSPVSPKPLRNALLGLAVALLIAAGLAPALEALDRRIRTEDELTDALGVPTLALIPDSAFPGKPPSPAAREAFQTLRAALTYFNVDKKLEVILICSPGHGEGKTTVATNLAAAIAQDESNVILLDGDLRKPQVDNRLGIEDSLGVEQLLVDGRELEDAFGNVQISGHGSLRIIASTIPSTNPAVLLSSKKMRELVGDLSSDSDVVIVDTPPLLAVSDAVPLIRMSSGVVLVAKADQSSRDGMLRAKEMIEAAQGTLLGAVLTGVRSGGVGRYGGYGYYSYYAVSESEESDKKPDEPAPVAPTKS